jgi:transcription elongation factor SPT6
MSNSMRDLVMGEADEGSSEDESYDEDVGQARSRNHDRPQNGRGDDSSEEEEDDDDEEEAAKVIISSCAH